MRTLCTLRAFCFFLFAAVAFAMPVLSQSAPCAAAAEPAMTAARTALLGGSYEQAEGLYAQELARSPNDATLAAGLVDSLLHEGKLGQATAAAEAGWAVNARSAPLLTALGEVQLRDGRPWVAAETLGSAIAADPCDARAFLLRSRAERIDSMYGSERKDLQRAYELKPEDPEIKHAWNRVIAPAEEICRS